MVTVSLGKALSVIPYPKVQLDKLPSTLKPDDANKTYQPKLDRIRRSQYPYLRELTYLDHAGTTLYPLLSLRNTVQLLSGSCMGNPHSISQCSQTSTHIVQEARNVVYSLLDADPDEYDVIFVSNASQGVKLVVEGFKDTFEDFDYVYSIDSHTSLIGPRTVAKHFKCFKDPYSVVEEYSLEMPQRPVLVSWTGQSNFTGERFPISQYNVLFKSISSKVYTLLDAASLSTSKPPSLRSFNSLARPDFVVLSLYKVLGYPDIGALVCKKSAGSYVFSGKKYFSGGTVEQVALYSDYAKRNLELHSILEEGTLPIHTLAALVSSYKAFLSLYGSFFNISDHVSYIAGEAYAQMSNLVHNNGVSLVRFYGSETYGDSNLHGPIIAFNLFDSSGEPIGYYKVEKAAFKNNICLRVGAMCNYGGLMQHLGSKDAQILNEAQVCNFTCGDENDIVDDVEKRHRGVVRISFGAMTSEKDIQILIRMLSEFISIS
ncbi:BA75_00630T0 [Komagataella pastoris]|uniref:BA75_00630T0 n=1 Tax=Komagataella pastoris TaxID=4922 RepID=A0A1B2J5S8_PICPA|nr:BA75_00630T0 [Komagataella pastoris]